MEKFLFTCMMSGIFFVALYGSPALAADAYLELLEQEAEGLILDQKGQVNNEERKLIRTIVSQRKDERSQVVLPVGLTRDAFETLLAAKFHNTYLFFKQLNKRDKASVYTKYVSNAKPDLHNLSWDIKLHLRR